MTEQNTVENQTAENENTEKVGAEETNKATHEASTHEESPKTTDDDSSKSEKSVDELVEEVNKWKALSRKNEERAADNKKALEQVSEAAQSIEADRAAFEEERASFIKERELTSAGLNPELSVLLSGKTTEEISAQVELIKKSIPQEPKKEDEKPHMIGNPFLPAQHGESEGSPLLNHFTEELNSKPFTD